MTAEQLASFLILGATMGLFAWGRWRYDLVAMLGLLAALATGVVPADKAFTGFGDDVVVIVGCALVVSTGVARSGLPEMILQRAARWVNSAQITVLLLVSIVALLSAFVKNIGALALMVPVALRMAARNGMTPSRVLMPMSFGALLGGLMTLIGTSPNVIVSRMREEMTGSPFALFDFAPVGVGITLVGIVYLCVAFRVLPQNRKAALSLDAALGAQNYVTEAYLPAQSSMAGKPVTALIDALGRDIAITAILRGNQRIAPLPDATIRDGDVVILQGQPEALQHGVRRAGLNVEGTQRPTTTAETGEETRNIEAIVGPASVLIGETAASMRLHEFHNINLLALSRAGERLTERLQDIVLREGDMLLLQGGAAVLPERLTALGCLPLAEREIRLGSVPGLLLPIAILSGAMAAAATGLVPVAVAFFAGAVGMVLFKVISPREAYAAIDWPILIMLAALIPLSEAIQANGGAQLIAHALADLAGGLPAAGTLALIMAAAMAVTPFLNNAATVLIMAPIAVSFASDLGFKPDAFLMAVAIGAGCDFLTPTGHQCNTMVFQAGGYKFSDYARLGAPLTVLVLLVSVPLILAVWPLR